MKKILKLTFLGIIITCTYSCLDLITPSNYVGEGKVAMKRITVDSLYSIEIPKYMKKTTVLNDDASLQYMNAYKETYVIVINESIEDFKNTFVQMGDYDTIKTADRNYKDIQLNFIKETIGNYKIYDHEYLKIHELNASLVKVEGKVDGYQIFYQIGFLEGKKDVYMVMIWTEKKKKNRYHYTFQKMIESFKLVE